MYLMYNLLHWKNDLNSEMLDFERGGTPETYIEFPATLSYISPSYIFIVKILHINVY
jgi:hypothetical protein